MTQSHRLSVRQHMQRTSGEEGSVHESLGLQSMAFAPGGMPIKGSIDMRIHTRFSERAFRDPSVSDYVPENMTQLNALIISAVNKNSAIFDDGKSSVMSSLGKRFEPTQPEVAHLSAPVWLTSAGVLPGQLYWTNIDGMDPWPERMIGDTLSEVLKRHNMTESAFARKTNETIDGEFSDTNAMLECSVILGETVVAPASTIHYLGDIRIIPIVHKEGEDMTITGNVQRLSGVRRQSVENFSKDGPDQLSLSDDCEGSANFEGEMFRSIRDQKMTQPATKALQRLARMYAGAGNLVTVTSANVTQDDKKRKAGQGTTGKIGDETDRATKPGAHENLQLIPKRIVYEQTIRASPSERDSLRWSDGTLMKNIPKHQRELPVLMCEGTGLLHPLFLADEAYHASDDRKMKAVEQQEYRYEAFTRLVSGQTTAEREKNRVDVSKAEKMFTKWGQFVRGKDTGRAVINHPDVRGPFYRMPSEKFFIPEVDDPINAQLHPETGGSSSSSSPLGKTGRSSGSIMDDVFESAMNADVLVPSLRSMIDTPVKEHIGNMQDGRPSTTTDSPKVEIRPPQYSWLQVTPVTVGTRPTTFSNRHYDESVTRLPKRSETLYHGTNTMDELNKQSWVGLARGIALSDEEMIAVRAIARNLPPVTPMTPMSAEEHLRMDTVEEKTRTMIEKAMKGKEEQPFVHSNSHVISYFIRTPDLSEEAVAQLASHAVSNPYVLSLDVKVERYGRNMSMTRFDYLVNMAGWKGILRDKVHFEKRSRA